MGPGHFAIALAAKPTTPKVPLWVLLIASEALDLLSSLFVATGVEKMAVTQMSVAQGLQVVTPGFIPWSHGLFMSLVWSALGVGIGWLFFHDRRASLVIGLVVFSHWVLDLIVHLPDLPLFFAGSPEVGLGLWGSGPGFIFSCVLEVLMLTAGMTIYFVFRRSKR